MKLPVCFRESAMSVVKETMKGFDAVVHDLGRGALKVWMRILMRELQGQESNFLEARREVEQDYVKDDFDIHGDPSLEAGNIKLDTL